MEKELFILAASGIPDAAYELGLRFCMQNDSESAWFWFKRAAYKGHAQAIEMMHEILDKNLIKNTFVSILSVMPACS